MTIDEMIEVLQAMKRGEAIQWRASEDRPWWDSTTYSPEFTQLWRVKPKPHEIWLSPDGDRVSDFEMDGYTLYREVLYDD